MSQNSTLPSTLSPPIREAAPPSERRHLDVVEIPAVEAHVGHLSLQRLDDRGRYILEKRLLNEEPMSLAQIGKEFGVSRERARQLELRVKKKLQKALAHLGEAEIAVD